MKQKLNVQKTISIKLKRRSRTLQHILTSQSENTDPDKHFEYSTVCKKDCTAEIFSKPTIFESD